MQTRVQATREIELHTMAQHAARRAVDAAKRAHRAELLGCEGAPRVAGYGARTWAQRAAAAAAEAEGWAAKVRTTDDRETAEAAVECAVEAAAWAWECANQAEVD